MSYFYGLMQFPMVQTNLRKWMCIHTVVSQIVWIIPQYSMFYDWLYSSLPFPLKKKKKKIWFSKFCIGSRLKSVEFSDIFGNTSFCYQLQVIFRLHIWSEQKKMYILYFCKNSFSVRIKCCKNFFKPCNSFAVLLWFFSVTYLYNRQP